jgi:hypothetical protein
MGEGKLGYEKPELVWLIYLARLGAFVKSSQIDAHLRLITISRLGEAEW